MLILQDPITKKRIVAIPGRTEAGGWDIVVSSFSFVYSRLKDNPHLFLGMVFQEIDRVQNDDGTTDWVAKSNYVKVTRGVSRWVKSTKKYGLPDLEYLGVLLEPIGTLLEACVEINSHNEKCETNEKKG